MLYYMIAPVWLKDKITNNDIMKICRDLKIDIFSSSGLEYYGSYMLPICEPTDRFAFIRKVTPLSEYIRLCMDYIDKADTIIFCSAAGECGAIDEPIEATEQIEYNYAKELGKNFIFYTLEGVHQDENN